MGNKPNRDAGKIKRGTEKETEETREKENVKLSENVKKKKKRDTCRRI